jgi:putative Mn2+ efflux pump MntP
MDLPTIILIAVGLAMDAFAVSIAKGICVDKNKRKHAIILASFFGGFQMLMPAIGWLIGLSFQSIIMNIDHWIAFGLLAFIGGKMIYDAVRPNQKEDGNLRLLSVLTLAVATSIDALMVGLSFAFINVSIFEPILIIGLITFTLTVVGFFFGCGIGQVFGNRIKIVGGIILILLGLRILLEHIL